MIKTYCDICDKEPKDDLDGMTWLHIKAAEEIDSSWQIYALLHICQECAGKDKTLLWIKEKLK